MENMKAFAMGQATQDEELKVFDWDKAAKIIKEKRPEQADALLERDEGYTGGCIWRDNKPYTKDYTYLASTWATPILRIDNEEIECFKMKSETDWDSSTKWPDSALDILNKEGEEK